MNREEEFEALRPLLFAIAYRLLGSVSEAEDAVQETWLRFQSTPTQPVSTKAFLTTVVARISIDVLRSARVQRQVYAGPWFPEPLVSDPYDDPERSAELADSVSTAALLLLERLSPLERAVFVLHEVFDFGYPEIATTLGRSETACRQLGTRARRHMADQQPRFDADRGERDRLAARFFDALSRGDVGALRDLLAADVQLVGDSGGKAPTWGDGIFGAERVTRMLLRMMPALRKVGVTFEPQPINAQPGAVFRDRDGHVLNTWTLEIVEGRIRTVRTVLNPDKLAHVGPVADAWTILREATHVTKKELHGPR